MSAAVDLKIAVERRDQPRYLADRLEDRIGMVLFALSVGASVLLLVLVKKILDGIQETDEQRIFAITWPAALLAGITLPSIVRAAQCRWMSPRRARFLWPVLGAAHTAFWVFVVHLMQKLNAEPAPTKFEHLSRAFKWIPIAALGVTATIFFGLLAFDMIRRHAAEKPPRFFTGVVATACIFLTIPALTWVQIQYLPTPYTWQVIVGLCALSLLVYWSLRSRIDAIAPVAPRLFARENLLVLVALFLLLWFPEISVLRFPQSANASSSADIWIDHYNYYLGAVAGVLAGRSPLVDANAQYGVGVTYFIALMFKSTIFDRSSRGMAHLICVMQIIRYFALYLTLRRITRSFGIGVLFVCIALGIEAFATNYVYIRLPNEGPLRFFVEFMLVTSIAFQRLGRTKSGERRAEHEGSQFVSLVLVAIGALWSPDVAVTVIGTYLGTRALVAWRMPASKWARIKAFVADFGMTIFAACAAWSLLALEIRFSTRAWPIWDHAIEWPRFYATWNMWTISIDPWAPWLPVGLIYLGSATATFFVTRNTTAKNEGATIEMQTVLAMSLVGISEMNYYIGRSFTENLAAVSIAAVFVACYWTLRLVRASSGLLRVTIGTAGTAAALVALGTPLPGFAAKLPFCLLSRAATGLTTPVWQHSPEAVDADILMNKYLPNHKRVAIFINMDTEIEALLMAQKTQLWPLSYAEQDAILPRAHDAITNFKPNLRAGEVVIIGNGLDGLQKQVLDSLMAHTKMEQVESTPSGVKAMRVIR